MKIKKKKEENPSEEKRRGKLGFKREVKILVNLLSVRGIKVRGIGLFFLIIYNHVFSLWVILFLIEL